MRTRARGFTLAETVMALSMTLVIGLALTGVAMALSNMQANNEDYYEHMHGTRAASNRLQGTLRRARLVLAASADELLVWTHDDRGPGVINASEIMIVYRDPVTQCLVERSVIFPPEMSDELRNTLDVELTLAMAMGIDADMANGSLGSLSSYCLPRVLVHDVREFTVYCDVAAPLTRMVRFSIDVGADTNVLTLNGAATLRAARIGDLGEKDGDYFLTPPDGG